ncbi:sugar transferase [Gammaproteobacteria bacterium]|nr:sugar transferase [Gammaproteobacteria bacterium]
MIRILDIIISSLGLLILSPLFIFLGVVCFFDTVSPIFRQSRIGQNEVPFTIFKFRTMKQEAVCKPSHLVDKKLITPLGYFLRKYKLDEIPQLWNVLIGDMSLVGPRPCLPIQEDVILQRKIRNIFTQKPGITGLAQILGVDMQDPDHMARLDEEMLKDLNLRSYIRYLTKTLRKLFLVNSFK